MDRAPVDAQVLRRRDRSCTCRCRAASRPARAPARRMSPRARRRRSASSSCCARRASSGSALRIRRVEVAARADDAVEVVAELDAAAEHALVHRAVGRRVVREAHAPRPPVAARGACAASGTRRRSRAPSTGAPGPPWPTISSSRSTTTSPALLDRQEQRIVEAPAVARRTPRARAAASAARERADRAARGWKAAAPRPSAGRTPRRRCAPPTPPAARAPRRSGS